MNKLYIVLNDRSGEKKLELKQQRHVVISHSNQSYHRLLHQHNECLSIQTEIKLLNKLYKIHYEHYDHLLVSNWKNVWINFLLCSLPNTHAYKYKHVGWLVCSLSSLVHKDSNCCCPWWLARMSPKQQSLTMLIYLYWLTGCLWVCVCFPLKNSV